MSLSSTPSRAPPGRQAAADRRPNGSIPSTVRGSGGGGVRRGQLGAASRRGRLACRPPLAAWQSQPLDAGSLALARGRLPIGIYRFCMSAR
ncbi:hypothetical protein PSMK_03940 [Phycisphaera mikurensis NBRC 102666]|uniref:Uncharacterized protein n=1 Tax=Phycisphaera mikurensis (strain NBRC 102666 / KCTC 22515 / FYK2301M01) TaxID=1142394 RepID=I0IBB5_PHYMF|nr:hypothetical protein PSMK_03940 [Phycisphaera mikurensis NBRC 102666]